MRPADQVTGRIGNRLGGIAGWSGHHDGIGQEWRARGDCGEFCGELAITEVQRALPNQTQRGGIPECRGTAIAEHDLVALRQREQLAQAGPDPPDQGLNRRLPVRGTHHRATGTGQCGQLLGTDLRWPASEPAVGGLEVGGDGQLRGLRHTVDLTTGLKVGN